MFFDKLVRFLEVGAKELGILPSMEANRFLGDPKDCIIMKRALNIDEMEKEEDEKYIFLSPSKKHSLKFDRFQTKIILKRLNPLFDMETVDRIITLAWNFNHIQINTKTGEFGPFLSSAPTLPPLPASGGPPRKTILVHD